MNAELIRKAGLESYVVRGKKYHSPLPFEPYSKETGLEIQAGDDEF